MLDHQFTKPVSNAPSFVYKLCHKESVLSFRPYPDKTDKFE